MTDLQLRARVLLGEARALGLDLADLIAADTEGATLRPTVAGYIETIAPTFTTATAATYRPYWRLAAARLGDRRLAEVTTLEDLTTAHRVSATRLWGARSVSAAPVNGRADRRFGA